MQVCNNRGTKPDILVHSRFLIILRVLQVLLLPWVYISAKLRSTVNLKSLTFRFGAIGLFPTESLYAFLIFSEHATFPSHPCLIIFIY
jgi:hypothetical protein